MKPTIEGLNELYDGLRALNPDIRSIEIKVSESEYLNYVKLAKEIWSTECSINYDEPLVYMYNGVTIKISK
jgi:hypothetical protein